MDIEVVEEASGTRVLFSGNATVDSAARAREELLRVLDKAGQLIIDVGGLVKVDVSFFQVLIAAEHSAMQENKSVRIDAGNPSEQFTAAALRAGFCHGREHLVPNHTHPILSEYFSAVMQEGKNG